MNKVLVELYVPIIEEKYNIWIPTNRRIHNVIRLTVKALNELTEGQYNPKKMPLLYDKQTAKLFDINLTIRESTIKNGSEIVLI